MKSEKPTGGALGLDVGTSRICVAREDSGGFRFRTELNAFVNIPYSKMTENVLKRESIPHAVQDGGIVVHGNESEKFADLLNVEMRRTMTGGLLSPSEPESLNMMRQILSSMLGEDGPKKLVFTVPAPPMGAQDSLTYHEATIRQILSDLGYEVRSVNEGLAVIYSELESSNYTGIGISCGGGLCNVCMAYLSVPVLSFSIPRAGDYIDLERGFGDRRARQPHPSDEGGVVSPQRLLQRQGASGAGGLLRRDDPRPGAGAARGAHRRQDSARLGRPIPLVISGGTTLPSGFRERFEKILKEENLPVPISEVRLASETSARFGQRRPHRRYYGYLIGLAGRSSPPSVPPCRWGVRPTKKRRRPVWAGRLAKQIGR